MEAPGLPSVPEGKEAEVIGATTGSLVDGASVDGSTSVGSLPSNSSLSTTALARQIEMRERIAAAYACVEFIRTAAADDEPVEMPTCEYWPAEWARSVPQPRPWTDARELFPVILERRFQYNFENGKVTASFETRPDARIKVNVFRSGNISEDRVFWGKDLQYEANTRKGDDKEVAPEHIRTLCNDVYTEMKASAHAEIAEKVLHTAGEAVWAAQRELVSSPPDGFVHWDEDIAQGTLPALLQHSSPEESTAYPYNFGVRLRQLTGPTAECIIHFRCLANEKCRRKGKETIIQFDCQPPAPPPIKSLYKGTNLQSPPRKPLPLRKIIEQHLQDEHWNQLMQTGWAPALQKCGPLGERERSMDYCALPVREYR